MTRDGIYLAWGEERRTGLDRLTCRDTVPVPTKMTRIHSIGNAIKVCPGWDQRSVPLLKFVNEDDRQEMAHFFECVERPMIDEPWWGHLQREAFAYMHERGVIYRDLKIADPLKTYANAISLDE